MTKMMRKWLIPLAVLALLVAGATTAAFAVGGNGATADDDTPPIRSDEGIDPNECNLIHNITACSEEELDAADILEEPPGDTPPIRSDEGIDPNECNLVHNINACTDEEREAGQPLP